MNNILSRLVLLVALVFAPCVHAQSYGGGFSAPPPLAPAPYLGVVATRGAVGLNALAGITHLMNRTGHVATQNLTAPQVVWANWYVNSSTFLEANTSGTMTITASIEYPVGTFTQLKFSGSASGSVAAGSNIVSDAAALNIPQGALFYVRSYQTFAASSTFPSFYPGAVSGVDTANWTVGDLTMGGTVTAQSAGYYAPPVAILSVTTAPSLCLVGDSIMHGYDDFSTITTIYAMNSLAAGVYERMFNGQFGLINMGVPGDAASGATVNYTKRAALANLYCTHIIDEYGVNDIIAATSAATIAGYRATIAGLFPGKTVIGTTISLYTTSTDSWATTANQTVTANEAARVSLNALIRAGIAGKSNYIDYDFILDPGATGKWPVNGAANYATPDGVHPSRIMSTLAAQQSPAKWMIKRTP